LYAKGIPLMAENQAAPYIVGGGGTYVMKREMVFSEPYSLLSNSRHEGKLGVFGGGGVDFEASSQINVDVFAKLHAIPAVDDDSSQNTLYFTGGLSVGFGLATR
jgi:hypothetical protein